MSIMAVFISSFLKPLQILLNAQPIPHLQQVGFSFYKINFSGKTSSVHPQFVTIPTQYKLGTDIFYPTQSINICQFSNEILLTNR